MGEVRVSAEQQARDMLERMGIEGAQKFSAGDVVELANLIAEVGRQRTMSAESRLARYETIVHASNRNAAYGIPVTVYANSVKEARERAIHVGWDGRPDDAGVAVQSVHDAILAAT